MQRRHECFSREIKEIIVQQQLPRLQRVLIKPEKVTIRVGMEGGMFQKRAVRAYFKHAGVDYALKVTDPVADAAFRAKKDGDYAVEDVFVCVSLTEPYEKDNRCHKLAAAIISNEPF
jgi:hypothetical protein